VEILTIWHLKRAAQIPKVFIFNGGPQSTKQEDLTDIFKKVSKSSCTSTIVASPEPLPPHYQLLQLWWPPKTQKRAMNQQIKEISKRNTPMI